MIFLIIIISCTPDFDRIIKNILDLIMLKNVTFVDRFDREYSIRITHLEDHTALHPTHRYHDRTHGLGSTNTRLEAAILLSEVAYKL